MGYNAHQLSTFLDLSANRSIVNVGAILFLAAILAVVVSQFFMQEAFADSNSAALAYRSNTGTNTLNSVKYREWNPSSLAWGSEVELPADPTTSNIRFAWVEFSPISSKRIIVSLQSDGTIDSYVCSSGCTTTTNWMIERDVADLWSTAPTGAQRPFDIEFEKTSGDLILVYDKVSTSSTQELFYRVMPAGEAYFGAESAIDDTTSSLTSDIVYSFIRMDSQKTSSSDVVGMIALDETDSDAIAWRWDGSSWGNLHELTASAAIGTEEDIGVAFETSSGDMIIVSGEGTSIRYNQFSSGSWGSSATFATWAIGTINWVTIKADPVSTSNAIFVAASGDLSDMDSAYWSGSAWTDHSEHDAGIDSHAARVVDFAWDNTGSQGVLIWGTASGRLDYKLFSGTSTFGSQLNFAETSTHPWVQLSDIANPTGGDTVSSLGATLDATFDIGGIRWDGGLATAPVSTGDGGITTDTTVTTYESFKVAWQRSTAAPSWSKASGEGLGLSDGQVKDPKKQLAENIGLSDTLQSSRELLQGLNESLSLADSRTMSAARRLDETIALTDSEAFSTSKFASESVSLADAMSRAVTFSNSLAENLAAADQFTMSITKDLPENIATVDQASSSASKYLSENAALSEQIATSTSFVKAVSENLAATEIAIIDISKAMSENLAVTDLLVKDLSMSLSENVEIDDVLTTAIAYFHSIVENVELADLLSEATSFSKLIPENLAVGENIVSDLSKSLSEELASTETLAHSAGKSLSEAIATADEIVKDLDTPLSENLELSDFLTTSSSFVHAIGENLSFAEMTSTATSFFKSLPESLVMADLSSTAADFAQTLLDNLSLSDSLSSATLFVKSLSENLEALEIISTGVDKSMSEGLALADEVSKDIGRSLSESIEINELVTMSTQFVQTIAENLAITEFASVVTNFSALLSENLEAADEIATDISKSIVESVGTSDVVTTSVEFVRAMAENLELTDLPSVISDFTVSLVEQLAVSDVQSIVLSLFQELSENLSLDVIVSPVLDVVFSLSENLALSDTMTSILDNLVLSLGESIGITDNISDTFIDIFFDLIEPLTLATSLFTPEVAYQNSLISEGISITDSVVIGTQNSVVLNETIAFEGSANMTKLAAPPEEEEEEKRHHGSNREQQHRETIENLAISDEVRTYTSFNKSLSESLSVGGNTGLGGNMSGLAHEKLLDMKISARLDPLSTIYQLVPPAAVGTVSFEIANNANHSQNVILDYWYVDKQTGVKLFEETRQLEIAAHELVSESVEIAFVSPGEYELVATASAADDTSTSDTQIIEIAVPWITVNISPLLALIAISAAGMVGYVGRFALGLGRGGQRNETSH